MCWVVAPLAQGSKPAPSPQSMLRTMESAAVTSSESAVCVTVAVAVVQETSNVPVGAVRSGSVFETVAVVPLRVPRYGVTWTRTTVPAGRAACADQPVVVTVSLSSEVPSASTSLTL